jgi:2-polyprenyl-3-methyl-5-hydroxy-6-metoxy-1,4-benzoquinol methylase
MTASCFRVISGVANKMGACFLEGDSTVINGAQSDIGESANRLRRYAEFDRMNGAYLDWQLGLFRDYLGDRILEIGCGVGGILKRLPRCTLIHGLDVEEEVLQAAVERFRNQPEIQFSLCDLATCDDNQLMALQHAELDTVVAINVLEHIEDDVIVLQRAEQLLQPGGHLLLLVPAHQWLYGEYDRLDGHFRRYSKNTLTAVIEQTRFCVQSLRYFNAVGALGWWWQYRVLKKKIHGSTEFGMMNRLIPLLRRVEGVVAPPFGLSLAAVLRKRGELDVETGK